MANTQPPTLNDAQHRAARHMDGPLLVLAGPGSGKTTVILYRTRFLTEECGIDPRGILVVSFTKASAEEMRTRYNGMTSCTAAGVTFSTFHALFFRILCHAGQYTADCVIDGAKQRRILREQMKRLFGNADASIIEHFLHEMSFIRNTMPDGGDFTPQSLDRIAFHTLLDAYIAYIRAHRLVDFDSMLSECYALLQDEPQVLAAWRERYRYIMVDEAQDINRLQFECIRLLAAPRRNLFLVGDDDQSIYGFRGAQPGILHQFSREYPNADTVILETNYRATDALVTFSNAVIRENTSRFSRRIVSAGAPGEAPIVAYPQNPYEEAQWVASKIEALKAHISYEEIAVIYRMNIQAQLFCDVFTAKHIPFRARDMAPNLYEHWIARDIDAYFHLALNRADDAAFAQIINKPARRINLDMHRPSEAQNGLFAALYHRSPPLGHKQLAALDLLSFGLNTLRKLPAFDAIRCLRRDMEYDKFIHALAKYRKVAPRLYLEIADELLEAARQFPSIAEWLAHADASKAVIPSAVPGVTLTTMHSAKGLEFDAVFIVGAVDDVIPYRGRHSAADAEEERRLFYVALTRARKHLFISAYREKNAGAAQPSCFIRRFIHYKP